MKKIGGMAGTNSVTLHSEKYRSSARVNGLGQVETTVRQKSRMEAGLQELNFVPLLVDFIVSVFMNLTLKIRILLVCTTIFLSAGIVAGSTQGVYTMEEANEVMISVRVPIQVVTSIILITVLRRAAGFHAAEHKAVHAFEKFGTGGLDQLAEQERVHERCGNRLLFPVLIAGSITTTIISWSDSEHVRLFLLLLMLELVLQIDYRVGFERIRFTNWVSTRLQLHLTTREPTETELAAAREALRALLVAEGKLSGRT